MTESARHHLSKPLRTMLGMVDRKILDAAADELDRLNTLVVHTTFQASASYSEHKRQVAILEARIRELEHALGTAANPH